jgi:hypothetical protein
MSAGRAFLAANTPSFAQRAREPAQGSSDRQRIASDLKGSAVE